jgi:DNA replication and repair protein RecF
MSQLPTPPEESALKNHPEPQRSICVCSLKLSDFRNYADLKLNLDARPLVLTGPNGAGKTNILEAISLLSPGLGLRRARLTELARHQGKGGWAISARLVGRAGDVEIGTGIETTESPTRKRIVRVDRATVRSSRALLDHARVVWLTPAMDGLFTGGSSDRRRFLDRLVLSVNTRHGERVNAYERVMRERNRLFAEGGGDPGWFDAIEAQMAEHGVAVAAARRDCVDLLAGAIDDGSFDGPFPAAGLGVVGDVEDMVDAFSATKAEDRFRDGLAQGRSADRLAKRALSGPHLSDFVVTHIPKQMPAADCSTGEQKALLVGIVLAHAQLITRLTGETPLVLLDEIGAHLDAARRSDLFRILLDIGCQAWLTGTDRGPFEAIGDNAQWLEVADGGAERVAFPLR